MTSSQTLTLTLTDRLLVGTKRPRVRETGSSATDDVIASRKWPDNGNTLLLILIESVGWPGWLYMSSASAVRRSLLMAVDADRSTTDQTNSTVGGTVRPTIPLTVGVRDAGTTSRSTLGLKRSNNNNNNNNSDSPF